MLFIFPFGKELAPTIFSWFLVPESNEPAQMNQRSIPDELRGVSTGNETLCQMLDITSQTK